LIGACVILRISATSRCPAGGPSVGDRIGRDHAVGRDDENRLVTAVAEDVTLSVPATLVVAIGGRSGGGAGAGAGCCACATDHAAITASNPPRRCDFLFACFLFLLLPILLFLSPR
jgi:hypothetical protein